LPGFLEGLSGDQAGRVVVLRSDIAANHEDSGSNAILLGFDALIKQTLHELESPEPDVLPQGLSVREIDVIRHLALGETDGEIAATLNIGIRTVNSHVSAILRKLGVERRRQAAAWARANLELGRLDQHAV
jgi:DNA-binding NarL/FixJ family response regulator